MIYTYTIFDAPPGSTSGGALPDHSDVEFDAESDQEAIDFVFECLELAAAGLSEEDGYTQGDKLHALLWDPGEIIIDSPSFLLEL